MSGRKAESDTTVWQRERRPVLIVDDDPDHARLTRRALGMLRPDIPIRIVASGKEFLTYLEGGGEYSDRTAHPLPVLVMLDLRMPEMDGFEVLERIKSQQVYSHIPIVVLTVLDDSDRLRRAFALGAKSYLVKPIDMHALHSALSSLKVNF